LPAKPTAFAAFFLAIGGGYVFASGSAGAGGGIVSIRLSDGQIQEPGVPAGPGDAVPIIASDGTSVFFTGSQPEGGAIWSSSGDGTLGPKLTTSPGSTPTFGFGSLYVLGTDLFVSTLTYDEAMMPTFAVEHGATSGGMTTVIATSPTEIGGVTANATEVFWTEGGSLQTPPAVVMRAAHDGTSAATLTTLAATSLAADDTHVFLTTADSVVQIDLATGAQTVLASNQVAPARVQQKGDRVYWLDDTDDNPMATAAHPANAFMTACKQ
jgi:hypothetical protein